MIRYLTDGEILELHRLVMEQSGGRAGVRDRGGLESALAQPQMAFDGQELYPTLAEKAAALGFFLISNHPFVDGNKRTGHAAMEAFLVLNGHELSVGVDEQEHVVLQVASGRRGRQAFTEWVRGGLRRMMPIP